MVACLENVLGDCRALGVESEKVRQPTTPKSDRLLGPRARRENVEKRALLIPQDQPGRLYAVKISRKIRVFTGFHLSFER
jgi:hypothetical protein